MEEESKPEIKHTYKDGKFHSTTRFFNKGNQQITKVTVKIEQKDDCFTGCFKAISECFKR
jgi:predicted metalloprotease